MADLYPMAEDFAVKYGPWAVIAGGSEGIGESFARQLAAANSNLLLLARREGPLQTLADSIVKEHRVEVRIASVDLTSSDLMAQVKGVSADIDVGMLIYNAGSTIGYNRFVDWDIDDLDFMINLNCHAPVHLAHHFGKRMRDRGKGGMMFLTSAAGFAGASHMTIYPATKAFDQMLAEGLWHDMKPFGVDVLCLVVGATKTPSHAKVDFSKLDPGRKDGGAMECDDVAYEGLSHMGKGPVWIAGESNRVRFPSTFVADRATAIEAMSKATAVINGLEHVSAFD